jgi:hypothetical protein
MRNREPAAWRVRSLMEPDIVEAINNRVSRAAHGLKFYSSCLPSVIMSGNFPGHYTPLTLASPARSYRTSVNLINMSQTAESVGGDFDNADVPLSSTLVTSPNSPFGRLSRTKPLDEISDEERDADNSEIVQEASPAPPPRTPSPTYLHHPTYFYNDGGVFILVRVFLSYVTERKLNQSRLMTASSAFTHTISSATMEMLLSISSEILRSPNITLSRYPRTSRYLHSKIS